MIKIRTGAFETNSSSMHSLIIMQGMKEGRPLLCYVSMDEEYADVRYNDFERYPFYPLNHWLDKAAYYIADRNNCKEEDVDKVVDEVLELVHKHHPKLRRVNFGIYVTYKWSDEENRFVKEKHYIEEDNEYWMFDTYGGVDRQSERVVYDALKRKGIGLEEFLFDPKYVVILDGDEYCTFDTLIGSGFVDASRIEKVTE